jgi:hypothetical protein
MADSDELAVIQINGYSTWHGHGHGHNAMHTSNCSALLQLRQSNALQRIASARMHIH